MANITEKADVRFIGFVVMGFFLLLVGIFGLQSGRLFGDDPVQWPISISIFSATSFMIGVISIILTVLEFKAGEKMSAIIFGLFGLATFISCFASSMYFANSDWFMYMAVAIVFLVLAIDCILEGEHKLLALLLFVLVLMFVFLSLACYFDPWIQGPGNNLDVFKALGLTYGIFAFIGCALSMYIGLAYSNPSRLPLI